MTTTTASDRFDHRAPGSQRGEAGRLPSFSTPVRGHAFAPRHPDLPEPAPGEPAELVPEPGNPADPHAIAVWAGGDSTRRRIGYLDRGVAARVAPRLRAGLVLSAHLAGWTGEPEGRWQRPVVLLQAVSLPDDVGDHADRPARSDASATARPTPVTPGIWGRPPGVSRRTLGPKQH